MAASGDAQLRLLRDIPGFFALACATAASFGALALMLPVIPLAVITATGSETLAGATTTVFMATTVATQLVTVKVVRKFGFRAVMVTAALLLGVPTLWYVLTMDSVSLLVVAAIRGMGFGALCVAQFALIGQLAPPGTLGKASGIIGLFTGAAQMLGMPVGLWLVDATGGYSVVFVVGAAVALMAAVLSLFLPSPAPEAESLDEPVWTKEDDEAELHRNERRQAESPSGGTPRIYRRPRPITLWVTVAPAIAIACVSMGYGAVSTFLPATVREIDPVTGATVAGLLLAVAGGTQMVFRLGCGALADRLGYPGTLMIPGLLMVFIAFISFVWIITTGASVWWMLVSAVLFGGGFGFVATEAMLEMFMRVPRGMTGQASTIWNASFDTGTGIGAITLGYVASRSGYVGAYLVGTALVVIGLIAELVDRKINPEHWKG
ncbi:MAG: MFS transporter [Corynebacterium sp.]|uniref:MFS transporter n=1 Tax=Corynebacterium sp. TaxID=1720 RepID=UPI0026DDB933|nr:MFS transporter [Corynebacterium sp.]MDO5099837.1 MFS transporter [Corynebacterium sp.]